MYLKDVQVYQMYLLFAFSADNMLQSTLVEKALLIVRAHRYAQALFVHVGLHYHTMKKTR